MRIVAMVGVAMAMAGCLEDQSEPCGGALCDSNQVCHESACVDPERVLACADLDTGATCSWAGNVGRCAAGLCAEAACGDLRVDPDETCDDGNHDPGDGCDATCQFEPTGCGDGVPGPDEDCDDGNDVSGDGCDTNCTLTACGNRIVAGSEECDDGNLDNTDACRDDCTINPCGDGFVQAGEQCDDGNNTGGDGCFLCQVE